MRAGEVLEKFDLAGELGDEGLVVRACEHLVEEGAAGGALLIDDVALGEAGVDEQAEGKGEVRVLVEVADGLGLAVNLEDEVIFGEVLDQCSFFVADDDGKVDEAGVDGDGSGGGGRSLVRCGGLLLRGQARRKKKAGQKQRPVRAEDDHVDLDEVGRAGFQLKAICE